MRFVVYGAGAIGGVIGVRLLQAGHDVVLIARGEHLRRMQRDGLRFQSPTEDLTLPVEAVGRPSAVDFDGDEIVLMTMKSQHTHDALLDLRQAAGDQVPVVCAQNGVSNEAAALPTEPESRTTVSCGRSPRSTPCGTTGTTSRPPSTSSRVR